MIFFLTGIILWGLLAPGGPFSYACPVGPDKDAPKASGFKQFGQQAKEPPRGPLENPPGLGTQEIERSDGGKDKIYYSVVTPEEEAKTKEEEKEKTDQSWDILKNVIIDNRSRPKAR